MVTHNSITTEIKTITLSIAEGILSRNTRNRKISATKLNIVKRSLERGEWVVNGEAIKIASDGTLLDGQHRLTACVETGITFQTLVISGLPAETQTTMDTGKSRTLANVLEIDGYQNSSALASTVAAIIRSERWGNKAALRLGGSAYPVTNGEAMQRLKDEPPLVELQDQVRGITAIGLPNKAATLLYYQLSAIDQEDADYFFEHLITGSNLEKGNPILTLRELLLKNKSERNRINDQSYLGALVIKAWNKYRDGEPAKVLRFTPGGANPESFPVPH